MSFPLPGPDRRPNPSAGSGHPFDKEPVIAMTPDMERALGALRDFTRRDILLRFYTNRSPSTISSAWSPSATWRSSAGAAFPASRRRSTG